MARRMYVNGEWISAASGEEFQVVNPHSGKIFENVPRASREDIRTAVDSAHDAFDRGTWNGVPVGERANLLLKVADFLESEKEKFAQLESMNSGKSIKQSANYDLPYTIDNIRFLAGASRVLEGKAMSEYVSDGTSAVRREPIGVVGVITPWNYPLMMVVWRAFPAVVTGNTVVIKPASYTPITTLELAKLMEKAGLPKGVFNVVTGPGAELGEELASHPRVDMIAFTGSTEVGRKLSRLGSSSIKKVSLELGGKAPFIVFEDADVEASAEGAIVGGLVNNGQDCANATRFYVHGSLMDKFINNLKEKLSRVRIGNPIDTSTDFGPLISSAHRSRVKEYIAKGVNEGGTLIAGGAEPIVQGGENGFYLEPCVIRTDNHDSCIVKEEIFGPVFTILSFSDYDDAISKSNDVVYGLGASVWTKDITRAMRAIRDLRFGTVWVNEHVPVPSEMPWAGHKQSGHGASLSQYSLEEFTNIKHVYIDITGKSRKDWYYQIYGKRN